MTVTNHSLSFEKLEVIIDFFNIFLNKSRCNCIMVNIEV